MKTHAGDGRLIRYLRNTNPELDVIGRAIKGGWDISDDKRAEIIDELMDMVRSPNRSLAVKAARILKDAVADDRRHELGILAILERDQSETSVPYINPVASEHVKRLESATTSDIHAFMESLSAEPEQEED